MNNTLEVGRPRSKLTRLVVLQQASDRIFMAYTRILTQFLLTTTQRSLLPSSMHVLQQAGMLIFLAHVYWKRYS